MAIANVLLLSQAAGYLVVFVLSMCAMVPMLIHEANFKGHCLLYTTGAFRSEDGTFEPQWSSSFYCGFTLIVSVCTVILAFVQFIRMSIFMSKRTDSTFFSAFVDTVLAVLMTILVIPTAVFVTRGFSTWCSAVSERFPSCETATIMRISGEPDINPSGFFIIMGTVQFGVWTSLVVWVLLLVLAGRKLFVYHERENIIVSMARERHRYAGSGSYEQVS